MLIQFRHVTLQLRQTFRIARNASDTRHNILVAISEGNRMEESTGLGEIVPYPYYGQTCELAVEHLPALVRLLKRMEKIRSVDDVEEATGAVIAHFASQGICRRRCNHVVAALSTALLDHLCKKQGTSLGTFLRSHVSGSLVRPGLPLTSYTIGIDTPEKMKQKLEDAQEFKVVKIKLGTTVEQDMAIVRTLRASTGATLRVDANAGWGLEAAQAMLPFLETMGVEFVEQPLPPEDREGFRELMKQTRLPLFLDEGVVVMEDVERAARMCNGVNIKLSKCGGILESLKLIARARELGLQVMLGCMIESGVGLGAASHVSPWVDYADLDGNLLISNDPYVGQGNLGVINGRVAELRDRPGLGIVDEETDVWSDNA